MQGREFESVNVESWSTKHFRQFWHEHLKVFDELRKRQSAAHLLWEASERMVFFYERLLELGLDVSEWGKPQLVPVPVEQHPQTKAKKRDWQSEVNLAREACLRWRAVAAVGTHAICEAMGKQNLLEAAAAYIGKPTKAFPSDLETLATVCAWSLFTFPDIVKRDFPTLESEALELMLWALELVLLFQWQYYVRCGPPAAQEFASELLTSWARANISLQGEAGRRLKRVLEGEGIEGADQEAWLLRELPAALLSAWKDRKPREPLRSTGERTLNLTRRIGAILENMGSEATGNPEKVSDQEFNEAEHAQHDQMLEEFELRETARQELAQLNDWAEKARLSEQEVRVYELDMQTDHATEAIAHEIGVEPATVRVVRKRYRDKIRKVAGL